MLEVAPGVYTAPRVSPAVRERIWAVITEWFQTEPDSSIVMIWASRTAGGQSIKTLGLPPIEMVELDGIVLSRKELSQPSSEDNNCSLTT
jgi:CRISPR-associated protein Cas2